MSAIPCPIRLDQCPGADSPITNTSSESPDPFFYAGVGYNPYDPYNTITIDPTPKVDCSTIVWSDISQAFAYFIAAATAAGCTPPPCLAGDLTCVPGQPPWTFPPAFVETGGGGTFTPPTENLQQFTNDAVTVNFICPNGSVFYKTIDAGIIISPPLDPAVGPAWVEYINAWLLAYLESQILADVTCFVVPDLILRFPPGSPPPPDWPPGVVWPPTSTDPNVPPPDWPTGPDAPKWPPSSPRGPTMAANPGWCCLGDELDSNLCTYSVSSSHVWTFEIVGGMEPAGTFLVPLGNHSVQLLGTPSAPGIYTYTIRAHETGNPSIVVEVTDMLKVFGMVTTILPDGTVSVPYGPVQLQTAGGTEPVTFSLVGSLPAGLTLGADGIISGTPTTDGSSSFTVKFTDAENGTCQQALSITISSTELPVCYLDQPFVFGTVGTPFLWGLHAWWIYDVSLAIFSLIAAACRMGFRSLRTGQLAAPPLRTRCPISLFE